MPGPINHLLDTAATMRFHRLRQLEHGAGSVAALGWLAAYEPVAVRAYCQPLAPRVEVLAGYWPDDFAVVLDRE